MPSRRRLRSVDATTRPRRPRPWGPAGLLSGLAFCAALPVAGAVVVLLLGVLVLVASPIGAAVVAWSVWRALRRARTPLQRLRARWGSARVVAGGLEP